MNYATKEDLENLKKEILEAINKTKSEPKKEVWELYPDYKSCVKIDDKLYYHTLDGQLNYFKHIDDFKAIYIGSTSEKLAKRQLAELQLYAIAEKWGEGIEGNKHYVYFPIFNFDNKPVSNTFQTNGTIIKTLSFYFKTEEQCDKSLELHHQLWRDYFMK